MHWLVLQHLSRFSVGIATNRGVTQEMVNGKQEIDSCCSGLGQDLTQRFVPNFITTFSNFASGFRPLFSICKQTGIKTILKSSLVILITAESVCILTAETVYLIFINIPYSCLF